MENQVGVEQKGTIFSGMRFENVVNCYIINENQKIIVKTVDNFTIRF